MYGRQDKSGTRRRMRLTATDRNTLRTLAIVVGCSTIGGAAFGSAMTGSNVIFDPRPAMIGSYNGFLISLIIAGFKLSSRSGAARYWLNRAPFLVNVILWSVCYLAVFTLVIQSSFLVVGVEIEGWGWQEANFLIAVGASFAASIAVNAIVRMGQMLGRGELFKFLTGYYCRPREEERIFLFIDLVDSTATAERIGHVAFHRLLNDVIHDATEPILASQGEIHSYVGDKIIVTWAPERGLKQGNCIHCVNDVRRALERRGDAYRNTYGIAPKFRAALHMGPVVAGEMGLVKQAIVYLGDTVNTTARIEAACKEVDADILISADVADRLAGVAGCDFVDLGPIELRGRSESVGLYRLAA